MQRLMRLLPQRPRQDAPDRSGALVEPPVLELTLADLHRPDRVEAATRNSGVDLTRLYAEIGMVGEYVARLRRLIARLRPNEAADATLPALRDELMRLASETEGSTGVIVAAAGAILTAEAGPGGSDATTRASQILEACCQQDVAAQRLSRVLASLERLEARLGAFNAEANIRDGAEGFDREAMRADVRREVLLVEGPAAAPVDQSGIDRLFGAPTR